MDPQDVAHNTVGGVIRQSVYDMVIGQIEDHVTQFLQEKQTGVAIVLRLFQNQVRFGPLKVFPAADQGAVLGALDVHLDQLRPQVGAVDEVVQSE